MREKEKNKLKKIIYSNVKPCMFLFKHLSPFSHVQCLDLSIVNVLVCILVTVMLLQDLTNSVCNLWTYNL